MKIFTLMLTSLFLVPTLTLAQATYFVSTVEKGKVKTFYNRLASERYHVVVTDQAVSGAIQSLKVNVPDGQTLYIVEPLHANSPALDGEVGRIETFRIVIKAGETEHFHDHAQPLNYFEKVEGESKYYPTIFRPFALPKEATPSLQLTIEEQFLREKLERFSGAKPIEIDGQSFKIKERRSKLGRQQARAFLRQEFETLQYRVSEHDYGRGVNLIAEREGQDPSKILMITAHYDSVQNAGADDNASGVIGALAIAEALKETDLNYTLRIVAFDQEELGLVGSKAYVSYLNQNDELANVIGVINLEMLAYDSDGDGGFHVIDCQENRSEELTLRLLSAVNQSSRTLKKFNACTNRSDHASFWRYDVPAIVISQNIFGGDGNPCYHQRCDQINRLNLQFMKNLTEVVGETIASFLVGT